MTSSDDYRRELDYRYQEQRILRNHGCHEAARKVGETIDGLYYGLSHAMDREEREREPERDYSEHEEC